MPKNENISFLIKLLIFFQIINFIFPQIPNIIKVGGKNFRYIRFSKSNNKNILFETSTYPGKNEKKFYGFNKTRDNYFNNTSLYSCSVNNGDKTIEKYGGGSSFIVIDYCYEYYLSISNNYVEFYDFNNNETSILDTKTFFGYNQLSDIGSIIQLDYYGSNNCIFSFLANKEGDKQSTLVIKSYSFTYNFTISQMKEGFYNKYENEIRPDATGKMVSCYKGGFNDIKVFCFYKNKNNELRIIIYDNQLSYINETILDYAGNKEEDDNIFFKCVSYDEEIGVFIYYKSYTGSNPIFSMKTYREYDPYEQNITYTPMIDYLDFGHIEIDGKDFNRNYLLNDLIIVEENKDIYFASASLDREKLYFVVFSLNATIIKLSIKYYSLKMFELYQHKFYKEIKLAEMNSLILLGYSHCNKQKCEDDSLHYTSVAKFSEEANSNHDILENLYNSNENIENGITIDFNPYANSIFGKKVEYTEFDYINENITLINPLSNSRVISGPLYNITKFYLNISLNQTGTFAVSYYLYFSTSESNQNNEYLYSTETINGEYRRRIRLRHLSEKTYFWYNIKLEDKLTKSCDELCSLCVNGNSKKCITCKYGYSFLGDEKFCLNEDGNIGTGEINDIYNILKTSMEEQTSQIIKKDNAIFQLSTIDEQKNSELPEISSVDLGDCESLLRSQEQISDDEDFIMIKIDLKDSSLSATYVQYEIYNPNTLEIVSLDVCKDIPITLSIPVNLGNETEGLYLSLEQLGYNLFNINDSFYNDICSKYTAENGADMILSNRKNVIYDNNKNVSLCQKDCTFVSYNSTTKKAKCDCQVQKQETITDITKISFDKNDFADSFYNVLKNSNFLVMKCIKLVFSLKGQKNNIGSYMMSALVVIFISLTIFYILTGQKKIKEIIDSILEMKKSNQNNIKKKKNFEPKINDEKEPKIKDKNEEKKDENEKKEEKKSKRKDKKRKSSKKKTKKEKNNNEEKNLNAPGKRRGSKKKTTKKENNNDLQSRNYLNPVESVDQQNTGKYLKKKKTKKDKEKIKDNKIDVKDLDINKNHKNDKIQKTDKPNESNENDIKIFNSRRLSKEEQNIIYDDKYLNDEEINNLNYNMALVIDKRTYFQYYFSLLKKKHLILFIFLPTNDYNLIPIKIILFIISFSMYFTINGFFFSDDTMNKIYDDNGSYNFIYQLPQILYSTVVSAIINMILKRLSLSEKQIIQLKQEENIQKCEEKGKSIQKCLQIRFIIFLALTSILMLFFWYFISCFCAVYENTQTILIKDTLVSFALSMAYPFGLNLLPGFFRIPALRAPNKDKKILYIISTYVALI